MSRVPPDNGLPKLSGDDNDVATTWEPLGIHFKSKIAGARRISRDCPPAKSGTRSCCPPGSDLDERHRPSIRGECGQRTSPENVTC